MKTVSINLGTIENIFQSPVGPMETLSINFGTIENIFYSTVVLIKTSLAMWENSPFGLIQPL
jgi:hypothetical protein